MPLINLSMRRFTIANRRRLNLLLNPAIELQRVVNCMDSRLSDHNCGDMNCGINHVCARIRACAREV